MGHKKILGPMFKQTWGVLLELRKLPTNLWKGLLIAEMKSANRPQKRGKECAFSQHL